MGCNASTITKLAGRNEVFAQQLQAARLQSHLDPLELVKQHASKSWRAAAWLLEKCHPHLYGKTPEVALSDEEKRAAETAGGYAREMSDDYKRRQSALIAERAKAADIIITTALIPGRPAPVLVTEDTLRGMRPGSVVVDLAVQQGGNCAFSEPDQVVIKHGVKIAAPSSLPSTMAADSSALYARNVLNFVNLLVDPKTGELKMDRSDEIIAATLVCADGAAVRS